MSRIWAGIGRGTSHHHGLALDTEDKSLLSRWVANDEPELLKLTGDVVDLADGRPMTWAIGGTSPRALVGHPLGERLELDTTRGA
ncbi:hypothetical protein ADK54_30120 [Streptomyces sp. WM6378]|nr:hypothetical protein ADK54_30120 [Streptomyces sp. WM6378]